MKLLSLLSAVSVVALGLPAQAAIVGITPNVDLTSSPFTVKVSPTASYTFSYTGDFSSPVAVSVGGNATVYGNTPLEQGQPSALQLDTLVPDQLSLGEFFQPTGPATINFSIALVNIALRFMDGGNTYYGYAQVGGPSLLSLAYNDTPGGAVSTGEAITGAPTLPVPEPSTWAMMIGGFGLVGSALRRRDRINVSFA